jgi:hypothetical protein
MLLIKMQLDSVFLSNLYARDSYFCNSINPFISYYPLITFLDRQPPLKSKRLYAYNSLRI